MDGRGAIYGDALVRDDVGAIAKIPPGSFGAAEIRIQPANHIVISAAQFSAIGEDLKRELAATFDQVPSGAAVDAGAAGIALGEVYEVAVACEISRDDGLSESWFQLARLDRHWAAGFIYGRDDGYCGRKDAVRAAGWRVLRSNRESGAAESDKI